jgi:hypothetical protein
MWLGKSESVFLFHRTRTDILEILRKEGIKLRSPTNAVEQILEYFRVQNYPEKSSRMWSIFLTSTLNTFFKIDIRILGVDVAILGIEFNPEVLPRFKFYEYNHLLLMSIWNKSQSYLEDRFPKVAAQNVQLSEEDIPRLIEACELIELLKSFWEAVKLWDGQYSDCRALYCHRWIPPRLIIYEVKVSTF